MLLAYIYIYVCICVCITYIIVRVPTGICYDQNCRPSAGFSATDIQSATQPWGEQWLSSMDWSWKNHGKPWTSP